MSGDEAQQSLSRYWEAIYNDVIASVNPTSAGLQVVARGSSLHSDMMHSRLLRAAAQHHSPVQCQVDANGR